MIYYQMCCKPKKIAVTSENGDEHFIFVPCGKCLECQNQSRAEWVLRSIYELRVNKYAYFITLTYDDDHLPSAYMDNSERNKILFQIDNGVKKDYGDFLLDKTHLQTFLKDLNKDFTSTLCPEYFRILNYRKRLAQARKDKDSTLCIQIKTFLKEHPLRRLRFFATGEYGTLTKRPHYHILVFSPFKISELDLRRLCENNWQYGNVDIQIPVTNTAVFNYVAKHQIKEDFGTKFQNQVAPIFKITSTYRGGIGFNLRYDSDIKKRYANRETESQTIDLEYKDNVNTFPFPRYVRKFLHPDKLSILELNKLEHDSKQHVISMLKDVDCEHVADEQLDILIKQVFHENSVKDFQQKKDYFKNKYINKLNQKRNYHEQ